MDCLSDQVVHDEPEHRYLELIYREGLAKASARVGVDGQVPMRLQLWTCACEALRVNSRLGAQQRTPTGKRSPPMFLQLSMMSAATLQLPEELAVLRRFLSSSLLSLTMSSTSLHAPAGVQAASHVLAPKARPRDHVG